MARYSTWRCSGGSGLASNVHRGREKHHKNVFLNEDSSSPLPKGYGKRLQLGIEVSVNSLLHSAGTM